VYPTEIGRSTLATSRRALSAMLGDRLGALAAAGVDVDELDRGLATLVVHLRSRKRGRR
jgi:hypothetical protein